MYVYYSNYPKINIIYPTDNLTYIIINYYGNTIATSSVIYSDILTEGIYTTPELSFNTLYTFNLIPYNNNIMGLIKTIKFDTTPKINGIKSTISNSSNIHIQWNNTIQYSYVKISRALGLLAGENETVGTYTDISNVIDSSYYDNDMSGNTTYSYKITPYINENSVISNYISVYTPIFSVYDLSAVFIDSSAIQINFTSPTNYYNNNIFYILRIFDIINNKYYYVSDLSSSISINNLNSATTYNCSIITILDNIENESLILTVSTHPIIQNFISYFVDISSVILTWYGIYTNAIIKYATNLSSIIDISSTDIITEQTTEILNLNTNTEYTFTITPYYVNTSETEIEGRTETVSVATNSIITSFYLTKFNNSNVFFSYDGSYTNVIIKYGTYSLSNIYSKIIYDSSVTTGIISDLSLGTTYYFNIYPININLIENTKYETELNVITSYSSFILYNAVYFWYKFNTFDITSSTIYNYSSLNYDASFINGASVNTTDYIEGNGSLSLVAGNLQYVKVPSFTTTIPDISGGMAFVCWFKSNNTGSWNRIFDFGNGMAENNILLGIYSNNFGLYVETDQTFPITSTNYNDNEWHYLVWNLTYTGSNKCTWNVYVDNVLIYTSTNRKYPLPVTRTVNYLGKSNWTNDPYYNGKIDNFIIFKTPLTTTQMLNLYNTNELDDVVITNFTLNTNIIDSSSISFTYDGSYTNVIIKYGTTSGSTTYSKIITGSSTTNTTITDLSSNTTYYFNIYPINSFLLEGTVYATELSETTYGIITSFEIEELLIDSSSISFIYDGNYSNVIIKYGTTSGSNNYSSDYLTDSSGQITDLSSNTTYYFSIYPINIALVEGTKYITELSGLTNVSIFTTLLSTKEPWGRYSAASYTGTTLTDLTGNERYGDISGIYITGISAFPDNGSNAEISYINGTTNTTILWTSGSIPITDFTICAITRYISSDGSNNLILTNYSNTNSIDTIIGHWDNKRGMVYVNGNWLTQNVISDGNLTDWLSICVKTGGTIPTNILIDNSASGIYANTNSTIASQLCINNNGNECSDWGFSHLIIWDQSLTDYEMSSVSTAFANYLSNGIMEDVIITSFTKSVIDNSSVLFNYSGFYTNVIIYYGVSSESTTYSKIITGSSTTSTTIMDLSSNTTYYFNIYPIDGVLSTGEKYITELSETILPIINTFTISVIDTSYITLNWYGIYTSAVIIYNTNLSKLINVVSTNITTLQSIQILSLTANTEYIFTITPYGDASGSGITGITKTVSTITYGIITSFNLKTNTGLIDNSSVSFTYDGSYTNVIIKYGTTSGSTTYSKIITGSSTTSTTITDLSSNTTYYFAIYPINSALVEGEKYITELSGTTYGHITSFELEELSIDSSNISFTYDGSYTNVIIKYGTTSGSTTYSKIITGTSTTSATIPDLSSNTTYYFAIYPINRALVEGKKYITELSGTTYGIITSFVLEELSIDTSNISFNYDGIYTNVIIKYGLTSGSTTYSKYITGSSTTTATIPDLSYGTTYYLSIYPINSALVEGISTELIGSTTYPISKSFDTLLSTKIPWGRYSAASYTDTTLIDLTNNEHNATISGTYTTGTATGNGIVSGASIPYINGTTTTTVLWPSGSIPNPNFTICGITRYTTGTKQRILTNILGEDDFIFGHWQSQRGVLFSNNVWYTNGSVGTLTNWLSICAKTGGDILDNNDISNNILIDNVNSGTNTISISISNQLSINNAASEFSDWEFSHLIIWDLALTDEELAIVSNAYNTYLTTGIMDDVVITSFSKGIFDSSSINLIYGGAYTNIIIKYGLTTGSTTYNKTIYGSTTTTGTVSELLSNTTYYFNIYPIDNYLLERTKYITELSETTYGKLTTLYTAAYYDTSANVAFDGSFDSLDISTNNVTMTYTTARNTGTDISGLIPGSTYTVTTNVKNSAGVAVAGNTISFTTLSKITSFTTTVIDSSSIFVEWSAIGSISSVSLIWNTTGGSYNSATDSNGIYTISPINITGLFLANTRYYFQIIPINSAGVNGNAIKDISNVTYGKLTTLYTAAYYDTSANIAFDGSFTSLDISTNGLTRTYTTARNTGTDISGLIPGSTYTVTTNVKNSAGVAVAGNTILFTTLSKITSFTATAIDISSISVGWSAIGDISSVSLIWNTTGGSYNATTDSSGSYTTSPINITGLSFNTRYYFQVTPISAVGNGYSIKDISNVTYGKITSFSLGTIDSSSVSFTYGGTYSSVKIYYGLTTGSIDFSKNITGSSTTIATVSGLSSNTTYYFNIYPINSAGVEGTKYITELSGTTTYFTETFTTLLSTKVPWGRYSASSYSGTSLTDLTGNGRHGVITGSYTVGTASGNGSTASIPYINGLTTTKLSFPSGSIPAPNFTICSITRYTNSTNIKRILTTTTATGNNVLFGHWGGKRGLVHVNGWLTNQTSVGTLTNWLSTCVKSDGIIPNNVLIDGVASGISTSNNLISNNILNINTISTEVSDWRLSHIIIWDQVLTDSEMVIVSNAFNTYLSTGIMQ